MQLFRPTASSLKNLWQGHVRNTLFHFCQLPPVKSSLYDHATDWANQNLILFWASSGTDCWNFKATSQLNLTWSENIVLWIYSDCLRPENNLWSTHRVTALCVRVCCIVCVCDWVMVYTQAYVQIKQHTHTHKVVTGRVEAKKLLSHQRKSNYSSQNTVDLVLKISAAELQTYQWRGTLSLNHVCIGEWSLFMPGGTEEIRGTWIFFKHEGRDSIFGGVWDTSWIRDFVCPCLSQQTKQMLKQNFLFCRTFFCSYS